MLVFGAAAPALAQSAKWQTVTTLSGDASGSSAPFTVGGSWRIAWTSAPGSIGNANFQGSVARVGQALPTDFFGNVIGKGSATSYEFGAGTYYLQINADERYSVAVQTKVAKLPKQPAYHWKTVYSTSGGSIGNTAPFTVHSPWRIVWTSAPGSIGSGNFQISVEKGSSPLPSDMLANVTGTDKGTGYEYIAGTFHLSINADENYTIQVQQGH